MLGSESQRGEGHWTILVNGQKAVVCLVVACRLA